MSRLTTADFDNVIDLITAIGSLGSLGQCGGQCGFTVEEITDALRIAAPDNIMTDGEVQDTLVRGKRSGVFSVSCSTNVTDEVLKNLALQTAGVALAANGASQTCGVLCQDNAGTSINGRVNDPVNNAYSVCIDELTNNNITVVTLYYINQNMAQSNNQNQVYVDAINDAAAADVAARAAAQGITWPRPNPCGVYCEDSALTTGTVRGTNSAVCGGVFTTS